MRFEWDENKRLINLQKHGIDFADSSQVFENETATKLDERFNYEETQFFTLGLLNGKVVAIAHTENEEIIRVISIRLAEKYEQEIYFESIRN